MCLIAKVTFIIVCLALFQSAWSLLTGIQFPDDEEQREACDPGSGQLSGRCTPINSCPSALQGISGGESPVVCSFKSGEPVVCCTELKKTPVITPPPDKPTAIEKPHLKYPGCGVRKNISEPGGHSTVPFSWPWMVSIFSRALSSRPRFLCGGSLISNQYVLTAAHCLEGSTDPSQYYVVVQAHQRSRGYVHGLISIKVHENYTSKTFYDDIAIFRLTIPVKLSENVIRARAICLPPPELATQSLEGRQVVVTGWGDTSYGGTDSSALREAVVKISSQRRCNETYSSLSKKRFPEGVDSRMICAGVNDGSKDACAGDSGGPLVLLTEGLWVQVGIVSFGYRCGVPGYPGVYTRVSEYLDWIGNNTNIPRADSKP